MNNEIQQHFLRLYQQTFPQKEQIHIVTYTSISTGWESDLFALQLDCIEANSRKSEGAILKLYHGDQGIQKAQREFQGLQHFAQSQYPVPEALFAVLDTSPFGQACVAMEKIQGNTVADIFAVSSREKQRELITQCCQLYVDLHALDWKPFVLDPTLYQTDSFIDSWLTETNTFVTQLQPLVFDPIFNWLQKRSKEITCQRLSVTHGDFHTQNIIRKDDGTAFVIDWTGIAISDYRFDLAWTLLLSSTLYSAEMSRAILAEYEHLMGHSVEHIEFFEVIACTRRLFDITVSLNSGATALGMKSGAEETMRQMIEHIRLVYAQLQKITGCSLPEIERLIMILS